ncbi:nicotinamide riboside transporter PnuC [Pedobacter antarcticus]|uniref:Nicotinamide riboside transporter PnuC n=2 Tax=Pedobacter antarcticus TaxID=34086 RepID=A0A081PD51_9SPHI|nr:nicotinamide riboside transporter PnuC [Pedobacter antarcticus]KEQ28624.1 membrane protein [Pedobacter antarcticus 4BY]SDL71258.1 nicotinamide mononucleotide transporter [Pedobacter antarcticus]SFE87126.1 nicotinamide mononucleotide transporter [Pedobacter antarcticus]
MNLHEWLSLFFEQLMKTSLLEYLAVGFGISEVLLAKRNNIWLYPTGIISILLSMTLLFEAKLYAETLLNTYYLVMSVYGWILWRSRKQQQQLQADWSNRAELTTAILISAGGFIILYLVLNHFTDSDVPVWDAFVASTAWAGMWLLAKRRIENWIFLNISNLFAIPLLIHKKLPMFAVLTTVLFIVAIFGFIEWKGIIKKKNSSPKPAHV